MIHWGTESNPIVSTGRRQVVLLIALGFAAVTSVLIFSGWQLWQSRQDEVSLGLRNGQNLTALLSEHLSRVVSSVDLVLMDMAQDADLAFTKPGWDAEEAHEYLRNHLGASPMVRSLFIAGKDGATVADTRRFPPRIIDVSDREYFRALMDPASPSVHVGGPLESRYNGTWFLPIARRLVDANGAFSGIVGAGIELNYFRGLFTSLQVGPGGSIAVVHRDGRLVVRSPEVAGSIGRPLNEHVLFQEHLPQAQSGFFDQPSVLDGVPRFFSYQTVPDTPFIVVVGLAHDYVLAGWYASLKTYAMAVSACCAAIIVLTILLVRNQIRRNELAANALKAFRRFHTVFDGSADGLVAMKTSGRVLSMNRAAIRMFGCDLAQLDHLTINDLIPGLVRPDAGASRSATKEIAETIAAGDHAEREGRTLDGQAFPVDLRLNEIVEDGERIIVGSVRDLTERNKTAEALREAEARFQLLTENINIVPYTFEFQGNGRLEYVGPQAERLFGYPTQAWPEPTFWRDHVHPDDIDSVVAEERNHRRSMSDSYELEYRMIAADGRIVWIRDLVRFVTTNDDNKTGFGAFIDISDTRQRDQRLAQVQRMEAVGQLTGGLAHDLNNALTVIIGNLEMTSDGVRGNEKLLRATELALKGARRSADIVRRLLAFARRQPLNPREVDLNRLIHFVMELLTRSLGKELELETALAPGVWPVTVDPFQLEDALLSLVINARDAMPRGGKILIETSNVTPEERITIDSADVEDGQFVMIAVSDTGVGMPPEVLERVFEPFFTTKEVGKGSGLGLSAVLGFAQQSGGHVQIQSEPGRGTVVRLYLPRATSAVHADSADNTRPRGSERILVVEDDPLVKEFVASQLVGLGYDVVQASNAPEAMNIVASNSSINLLFSDISMPGGMNGTELAEFAAQRRPDLKILLTSGYADTLNADAIAALNLSVLSKPYSWDQLAIAIRKALDRADSPGAQANDP